jgi:hypothetical protein
MSAIWHCRPVITDIVGFVERHLPDAIAFAEQEIERTNQAREQNLRRAVERGVCAVGHDLNQPTPINSLGTAPCGYCESAKKYRQEHQR